MRPDRAGLLEQERVAQRLLGVVVLRVRLAGDQQLNGSALVAQEPQEPIGKAGYEVEAFVCGNAPCKADRQPLRIEAAQGGFHILGRLAAREPVTHRALSRKVDGPLAQAAPDRPQLVVGDVEHCAPHRRVGLVPAPVGPEMAIEQGLHLGRHP